MSIETQYHLIEDDHGYQILVTKYGKVAHQITPSGLELAPTMFKDDTIDQYLKCYDFMITNHRVLTWEQVLFYWAVLAPISNDTNRFYGLIL